MTELPKDELLETLEIHIIYWGISTKQCSTMKRLDLFISFSFNPAYEKCCSLNIKAIMLKTILFYCRYVQLSSVIHPALISHSFLSRLETFCRKPLYKNCKMENKRCEKFACFCLFLLLLMILMCIHVIYPLEN